MKAEISPKVIGVIAAVIVLAIVAFGISFFKSDGASGPPVKPKPWSPPSQWGGTPGANKGQSADGK